MSPRRRKAQFWLSFSIYAGVVDEDMEMLSKSAPEKQ